MTVLRFGNSYVLSVFSSQLYDQLNAFGAFVTDCATGPAITFYGAHASVIVDWLNYLEKNGGVDFFRPEPFALPLTDSSGDDEWAGRAGQGSPSAPSPAKLAGMRLAVWMTTTHSGDAHRSTQRATILRCALFMARTRDIDSALDWLIELVDAGWIDQWADLAVCFSSLCCLDEQSLARLPAPDDRSEWAHLDIGLGIGASAGSGVAPHHLNDQLMNPFVTHNGTTAVPFGVERQRKLLALAVAVADRARASESLDDWAMRLMSSQTVVSAVLRQFPGDRKGLPLSTRHVLAEFDEIAADLNPMSTAGLSQPDWSRNWSYARDVVEQLAGEVGEQAGKEVIERRLLVPRAVAKELLSTAALPIAWQLLTPRVILAWASVHGWEPRYASPRDYVEPMPSGLVSPADALELAKSRAELQRVAIPYFASEIIRKVLGGDLDVNLPLSMALADAPYSDEMLMAGSIFSSRKGLHDQAGGMAIAAILARPAEQESWLNLSRVLREGNRRDDGFVVYQFAKIRDWRV